MGIAAGAVCHNVSMLPFLAQLSIIQAFSPVLFGSMAVGLAILLMVITNTENPPAAGLALALVLNEWNAMTLLVILAGIISLSALKEAFRPALRDLL